MRNLYIFDCFGVIISEVSTIWMNNAHLSAEQQLYMRQKVFRRLDKGEITMSQMFEIASNLYGINKDDMIAEWTGYEQVFTDTLKIIGELRAQGHCIALLSNAAQDYVDYLFDKYSLYGYFDYTFVSSTYGYAKPDKEFYQLCVESFDEQFGAIYFTDDNPANLVDLQQFGITPVLFVSAQDFAEKIGLYN